MRNSSSMIFGSVSAVGTNCAGARRASERSHAGHHHLAASSPGSSGGSCSIGISDSPRTTIGAFLGEIQRDNRNVLEVDVLPHIQFGPVGERKHPDRLAFVDSGVIDVPQFGTLVFRVPLPVGVAERIDSLFRAGLLFVAPRSAKRRVKTVLRQSVQQRPRLQESAALLSAELVRVRSVRYRLLVPVDQQVRSDRRGYWSRNSIISRNLKLVSICSRGNGIGPG